MATQNWTVETSRLIRAQKYFATVAL